jgi:hypothetical protein
MVHHEEIHRDVRVRIWVTEHLAGALPGIIRKNNVMGTICEHRLYEEKKCRPLCVATSAWSE